MGDEIAFIRFDIPHMQLFTLFPLALPTPLSRLSPTDISAHRLTARAGGIGESSESHSPPSVSSSSFSVSFVLKSPRGQLLHEFETCVLGQPYHARPSRRTSSSSSAYSSYGQETAGKADGIILNLFQSPRLLSPAQIPKQFNSSSSSKIASKPPRMGAAGRGGRGAVGSFNPSFDRSGSRRGSQDYIDYSDRSQAFGRGRDDVDMEEMARERSELTQEQIIDWPWKTQLFKGVLKRTVMLDFTVWDDRNQPICSFSRTIALVTDVASDARDDFSLEQQCPRLQGYLQVPAGELSFNLLKKNSDWFFSDLKVVILNTAN